MKLTGILVTALLVLQLNPAAAQAPKSDLDNFQFDGVSSDAELKDQHHSRRDWLSAHPVQAKDYWKAWDCKGQGCDSTWNANIRAKAALIDRTPQDPKPASGSASSSR
jgi:hypothetical protein